MNPLLRMIEDGDVCGLMFLIVVLISVGKHFASRDPRPYVLGLRVAAGAGLAWAFWHFAEEGLTTVTAVIGVVLTSLLAGGLVLGPSWILLSVGYWLGDHFSTLANRIRWQAEFQRDLEEQLQRESAQRERDLLKEMEWERGRAERERLAAEAAAREAQEQREQEFSQLRRDEARSKCQLLFALHAADVGQRFSKAMLDDFLGTYMHDNLHPENVERRGRELEQVIRQHKEAVQPPVKPILSMSELTAWYLAERARLEALPVEADLKDEHLAAFETRYAELVQDFLRSMRP